MGTFSNQFFLLIVGAIISSLLIPWFFQIWQNQQAELEIKTNLISKITESVATMLMAGQSHVLQQVNFQDQHLRNQSFDNLAEKYKEWEIESAIIDSQLRAYFPKSDISQLWGSFKIGSNSFSDKVIDIYRLTAGQPSPDEFLEKRQELVNQMQSITDKILKAKITSFNFSFFDKWNLNSIFLIYGKDI